MSKRNVKKEIGIDKIERSDVVFKVVLRDLRKTFKKHFLLITNFNPKIYYKKNGRPIRK